MIIRLAAIAILLPQLASAAPPGTPAAWALGPTTSQVAHAPQGKPPEMSLPSAFAKAAAPARGRVGVYAEVLETGEWAGLAPDDRFPMQSVYKAPIALAALVAAARRHETPETLIHVSRKDLFPRPEYSPLRDAHPEGEIDLPLGELVRWSVALSDNTAADLLLRLAGGPAAVRKVLAGLGVRDVQVTDPEIVIQSAPDVQYRNWATPRGMAGFLRALQVGRGIAPAHRALLLGTMTATETGPHRLKAGLPAGVPLAHKTGTSGHVGDHTPATNDVGLVTLPDGRHLAIAVFVADARGNEAARDGAIAGIMRAAWAYFSATRFERRSKTSAGQERAAV